MFITFYKNLLKIGEIAERKHVNLEHFKKEHEKAIKISYKYRQISKEEMDKLLKVLQEI